MGLNHEYKVNHIFSCMIDLQTLAWTSYRKSTLKQDQFHHRLQQLGFHVCSIPVIHELCEVFNRSWTQIRPAVDVDGDWFSIVSVCTHIVSLV